MHEARPTLHASRRIDRPLPAVVGDIERSLTRRGWRAVGGPGPARTPIRAGGRRFLGALHRDSGTRIARVELEITAWSARATEIGLRPVGSRARRAARRRSYGDAATALLDGLVRRAELPAADAPGWTTLLRRAS